MSFVCAVVSLSLFMTAASCSTKQFIDKQRKVDRKAASSYLKDLQQSLHIKPPDAKWHPKNGRNNNEYQKQGDPYSEGDAQQNAQQIIKRVEEELHPDVRRGYYLYLHIYFF